MLELKQTATLASVTAGTRHMLAARFQAEEANV
jgi:hypothetical protein